MWLLNLEIDPCQCTRDDLSILAEKHLECHLATIEDTLGRELPYAFVDSKPGFTAIEATSFLESAKGEPKKKPKILPLRVIQVAFTKEW